MVGSEKNCIWPEDIRYKKNVMTRCFEHWRADFNHSSLYALFINSISHEREIRSFSNLRRIFGDIQSGPSIRTSQNSWLPEKFEPEMIYLTDYMLVALKQLDIFQQSCTSNSLWQNLRTSLPSKINSDPNLRNVEIITSLFVCFSTNNLKSVKNYSFNVAQLFQSCHKCATNEL